MSLHQDLVTQKKFAAIFEAAPWLKDSKNIIHMPVLDPNRDKAKEATKKLDGVSWKELHDLLFE